MDDSPRHFIILPYYCDEEIARYLKIAERLQSFPTPRGGYHFLLASSPRTRPSYELMHAYSKIGNVMPLACTTRVFGYPQGPTAMFWDCMEYLATHHAGEAGFGLWLESDMAPSQPRWIDRLSDEWFGVATATSADSARASETNAMKASTSRVVSTPIMMGCYVPEVYKHRVFKGKKLILNAHINGGACYSMDFAKYMPKEARNGVFDMAVFQYAKKIGRIKSTRQIAFSTLNRVRRDLLDSSKVLLHGFMQDKDKFIDHCCRPLTEQEKQTASWHGWMDRWETIQRTIRVQFVRRGQQAMLENMFLAKRKFDLHQLSLEQSSLRKTG
jgi:hypothetical protein